MYSLIIEYSDCLVRLFYLRCFLFWDALYLNFITLFPNKVISKQVILFQVFRFNDFVIIYYLLSIVAQPEHK